MASTRRTNRGLTYLRAVVFTLHVFFSRRASALPFCSQVDQLSLYAMLLFIFFRRFYRVLRREGVSFGKMFVLRAFWRVCVLSDVDVGDWKWVMEFVSVFFSCYVTFRVGFASRTLDSGKFNKIILKIGIVWLHCVLFTGKFWFACFVDVDLLITFYEP